MTIGDCHTSVDFKSYFKFQPLLITPCVAALTDGPESKLRPKLFARHYPTQTHAGVVYIWMGVTEPVPLEEDLPEEFFDPSVEIETYVKIWPMNWSLTMENSRDSHNSKIHRGGIRRLFSRALFSKLPAFWEGTEITEEGDNYICIAPRVRQDVEQGYFPGLGKKWPQHMWWRFRGRGRVNPVNQQKNAFNNSRPGGLYRLPSIACPAGCTACHPSPAPAREAVPSICATSPPSTPIARACSLLP